MGTIIYFTNYLQQLSERTKEKGVIMGLSKERMLEIEKIADKILVKTKFKDKPFIDIVSIVKKDGFTVQQTELEMNTTGCLLVNDYKKERLIVVNSYFKESNDEKEVILKKSRFITAHEYGHYILHKHERKSIFAHRDTYHKTEIKELEADYFARCILMPIYKFFISYDFLMSEYKDSEYVVTFLSDYFRVTRKKILARIEDIKELGIYYGE